MTSRRLIRPLLVAVMAAASLACCSPATASASAEPSPIFAYYYIWFDTSSWNRAKTDYPALGRYSSDERLVMRQHIRWAKAAGIEGFIVSWKSTPTLDSRLAKLVDVARQERFKLAVIYQGLDFEREPLPVARIAHDLDVFRHRYGREPVFGRFGKPLVIWSGTWRFSPAEVASVTGPRRSHLRILASQRNEEDYLQLARFVDGNAYYWSSVNPSTFPGYDRKLRSMGRAVHDRRGLWIAPAAPGFDARLVGGTTIVPRRDGATLRRQLDAATGSSPDVVGLISWNEFSENSHVEPSLKYGSRYLEVLADVRGARIDIATDLDSDAVAPNAGRGYGPAILAGLLALTLGATLVLAKRRLTDRRTVAALAASRPDHPTQHGGHAAADKG
jgi:Glycosyl hydrolase family 99